MSYWGQHLFLGFCVWHVQNGRDISKACGLNIQEFEEAQHLTWMKKKRGERDDKEDIKSPIQSVLFADKPGAETLMNTGWAVFGLDRTSVRCCFQVLPSHFSGDHPFDPVLIPSQAIIQPKSTTSHMYGILIHISLWLNKPKRKWKSWLHCCYCSFSPFVSASLSLFVLVLKAQLKVTELKGCCTLQ